MKQYAQRDFKKYLHYYTFPRWSAENKYLILMFSTIAMMCGVGGAGMSHMEIPSAIFVWHTGLAATLICLPYYIKGTYQKFMDLGWDTYY